VSVLCHNRLDRTQRSVTALLEHRPAGTELLITNNGSTDGTAEWLATVADSHPGVRVLHHAENKGISEGKNIALEHCTAPWFVSVDNDAIPGPGLIEGLRAGFDHELVAQVGRSGTYGRLGGDGVGHMGEPLEYIDGSCFMVRTDVAKRIGLCDPTFYGQFGCEDADFSLRLRQRGYWLAVRDVQLTHVNEPTNNGHGVTYDLTPAREQAHANLRNRWGYYLRVRRFDARVCIRRTGSLGDVLMASPLPRLIHEEWPAARIFVATRHGEVFAGNPHVEGVLAPEQAGECDYVYDLDGVYEGSPQISAWAAYVARINTASLVRIDSARTVPELYAQEHVDGLPDEPFVAIHMQPTAWPGRNVPARLWPGIADLVRARGFRPISIGMPAAPMDADMNLHDLRLPQLANVIERSAAFVGIDSAPFHVAQAYKKPAVVFFGAIDPNLRCLHSTLAVVQQEHLPCLGCHHRYSPPRYEWCGCERGDVACMETLELGRVRSALGRLFVVSETSKVRSQVLPYLVGDHGVDVGCGPYEKITPEAVGVDALGSGAQVEVDLNYDFPFAPGSLDWVWSSHCLEHLHDYRAVLLQWWLAIKPGGVLGLYLPHRDYYDNAWNADHKHAFTQDMVAEVLTDAFDAEILVNVLDVDDVPLAARPDRHYQTERYSFLIIARKPA
jgi:ADP-heptose:LPS heptosyltransferase